MTLVNSTPFPFACDFGCWTLGFYVYWSVRVNAHASDDRLGLGCTVRLRDRLPSLTYGNVFLRITAESLPASLKLCSLAVVEDCIEPIRQITIESCLCGHRTGTKDLTVQGLSFCQLPVPGVVASKVTSPSKSKRHAFSSAKSIGLRARARDPVTCNL